MVTYWKTSLRINRSLGDYLGLLIESIAHQNRGSSFRTTFRREELMKPD